MEKKNYSDLFFKFIDTYIDSGFTAVDPEDPLVIQLEALTKKNRQFFYIGDMLPWRIVYGSKMSTEILGINPEDLDPGNLFISTHPDDIQRHSTSRSRMVKLCHDMFISGDDYAVMSTNLKIFHTNGSPVNILIQGYVYQKPAPYPAVYCLFINTDISWFGPIKHGYHYYIGKDLDYLRVPDSELILTGCIFTDREFEVISLVKEGMNSIQIGAKLYISSHTVDTHRRNILKKTKKANIQELIIELQEKGFF